MKLYLVRHGEALPSTTDLQRPLSEEGRSQVGCVAKHLLEENAHPQHIYHSGILRAAQTAALLAEGLHVTHVEEITGLLPEDDIEPIVHQIATWTQDTLLVGHLPYIHHLLCVLSDEGHYVSFDTATTVCLEKAGEKWLIMAVLNP
jgi:phosphohistidine phosphatase